jgi:hypothetical protein
MLRGVPWFSEIYFYIYCQYFYKMFANFKFTKSSSDVKFPLKNAWNTFESILALKLKFEKMKFLLLELDFWTQSEKAHMIRKVIVE